MYQKKLKHQRDTLNFAQRRDPLNPDAVLHPRENIAEQQLIYYVYTNPDKCSTLLSQIPPDKFVTELNARIYDAVTSRIVSGEDLSFSSFGDRLQPEVIDRLVSIVSDYSDKGIDMSVAEDSIRVLDGYYEKLNESKDGTSIDDLQGYLDRLRNKK